MDGRIDAARERERDRVDLTPPLVYPSRLTLRMQFESASRPPTNAGPPLPPIGTPGDYYRDRQ